MSYSVQIEFFSFRKREDSTKQPFPRDNIAGKGDATAFCVIKDGCSIQSPTIKINPRAAGFDKPFAFNYAYIYEFGRRFYFCQNWSYNAGFWTADLTVDPLASWREDIGATSQYILRASKTYDPTILDTLYPTKASVTLKTSVAKVVPWTDNLNEGTYVLGIINGDGAGVGGVSYYVFTPQEFRKLNEYLLNNIDWLSSEITEITPQLLKTLYNPYQYITSVLWFPFKIVPGATVTNLKFGWWELTGISCHGILPKSSIQGDIVFKLPKHPQAGARGKFLNLSPYTRYLLDFRPFGQIVIDPAPFIDSADLNAIYNIDIVTGLASLTISPTASFADVVSAHQAQVGVPIQMAQIGRDYLATATNAINTAAGAVSALKSLDIGKAISGVASGIESTIKSSMPQMQTTGGNGSTAEYLSDPTLSAQFFPLVEEDNTHRGRPLCKVGRIADYPGYLLIADADLALAASKEEITAIKTYMETGFYYE